jgi:hypothetical protein
LEEVTMQITRRLLPLLFAVFLSVALAIAPTTAQQQQKPDILFIRGHDIGWMQPSIYHNPLRPKHGGEA